MKVRETPFAALVRHELQEAREEHPPQNSLHEGYAVLLEEVEEFWQEVKKKQAKRLDGLLLIELIQIGAMAQRVAEDNRLIPLEYQ